MDGIYMASGFVSLIMFLIVLAYMFSTSGNLRKIRDEAETQTRLLERIERNTRPPTPPGEKPATASTNYMHEKKSSVGTVLVILSAVLFVLLIVALARK